MTLRVVADENIPQIAEALEDIAEVDLRPGRSLAAADLANADALIVRSVTRVGTELLGGTPVRFVATATIGTDHIDHAALTGTEPPIGFASAAGSNANSVVEYILTALLELAVERGESLAGRTLGIIGCGNIGSLLGPKAELLGLRIMRHDPPRERYGDPGPWVSMPELLAKADIVTLHVPLNRSGEDRTLHLIGKAELGLLRPDAWLLNTSRGPVVDNEALLASLAGGHPGAVVLDVWEREPDLNRELMAKVDLATAHIAGYSLDGKLNGTRMVAHALRQHFGLPAGNWEPRLPPPKRPVAPPPSGARLEEELLTAARASYPIREDDARLREGANLSQSEWNTHFDRLRKEYPARREFAAHAIPAEDYSTESRKILIALGFRMA